jgi:DNA polymerase-3 subunit beta
MGTSLIIAPSSRGFLKPYGPIPRGILNACKLAEIIARETNNVIRMEIKTNRIARRDQDFGTGGTNGSSDVNLDATWMGRAITIAFNVRFLREVLDVVKTPSVVLETNAHNTPAILKPVGDDTFTHVIMRCIWADEIFLQSILTS